MPLALLRAAALTFWLLSGAGGQLALAQSKYTLTTGSVRFFSAAPLENIEARSTELKGILDPAARRFVFRVPIASFKFPSTLMQTHFNENYLESTRYPYATFRGQLPDLLSLTQDGTYPVAATGELTIHGVAVARTIPCTLIVRNGICTVSSRFAARLADHRIEVPTIVFNKIAETIDITVEGTLTPTAAPASEAKQ
ncbi:YceI family protein [Hymenobacter roseosalivarius DSM 11622]|uniref:YceI family protein n=1 Tax=Hymenobacter roseosalivarius DSM 11622 TaxID=645990 RepID=A0A1W1W516_9BACT|nr:YceI family protein [Hymenobacter roseosalivarius]SMC00550.1 YceI family protein [Hymenobacter roseosalivarius DSM 11622]